jgi:hypothetical protein
VLLIIADGCATDLIRTKQVRRRNDPIVNGVVVVVVCCQQFSPKLWVLLEGEAPEGVGEGGDGRDPTSEGERSLGGKRQS